MIIASRVILLAVSSHLIHRNKQLKQFRDCNQRVNVNKYVGGGGTLQHRGGIPGDVYTPRNSRQQLLRGGCRGWSTCREDTVASLCVVPRKDIRAP